MSGIYIPRLSLPTEEYGAMTVTIYPNGNVAEYLGDMGRDFGNAIPVPDHGRLIDADAFEKQVKEEWEEYDRRIAVEVKNRPSSSKQRGKGDDC